MFTVGTMMPMLDAHLNVRDDHRMVTGYGGTYRGLVVDNADPSQQCRLLIVVPEVYGDAPVWAVALHNSAAQLPAIGDPVLTSFEHGDTDYPIWEPDSADAQSGNAIGGYIGRYRGVVVDNNDPMQENRLEVTVAEVDAWPLWAMPSTDVQYEGPPEIGCEVWIEYDNGDPAYPRWVGLA